MTWATNPDTGETTVTLSADETMLLHRGLAVRGHSTDQSGQWILMVRLLGPFPHREEPTQPPPAEESKTDGKAQTG